MRTCFVGVLLALAVLMTSVPAFAIEAFLMRESDGNAPAGAPFPCPLTASRNGTCTGLSTNYKWYNICNGYIWIYSGWVAGEGVGVRFGGPSQPCVAPFHRVKRGIHYFRNVVPNYGQTVDLYLHNDCNLDGCPEGMLGGYLNIDPGLRWNCINYGPMLYCNGVLLRQVHRGGTAPTFATDGPFKESCDPSPPPSHSFYYGVNGSTCTPWVGNPNTSPDNFLAWIVIDWPLTPTQQSSWGAVKGLFQ